MSTGPLRLLSTWFMAGTVLAITVGAPRAAAAQDVRVRGPASERRVVRAALALVPRHIHHPVTVIDPDGTADPAAVRRLDAFTVRELHGGLRPTIYLNSESNILREAVNGKDFYVKVLAAVIVHEAAHLDGGGETEARAAERAFLEGLIERGLVRRRDGRRYLGLLDRQTPARASDVG